VFLYNDLPWIPYHNTSIGLETYGFCAGLTATGENTLLEMVQQLKNLSDADFLRKMRMLKVRLIDCIYGNVLVHAAGCEVLFHLRWSGEPD